MTDGIKASSDERGKVFWIAARDVQTIAQDTAIAKGIVAIKPETAVNVYFGTDSANDFELAAKELFYIHQHYDVKLKAATVCLIY